MLSCACIFSYHRHHHPEVGGQKIDYLSLYSNVDLTVKTGQSNTKKGDGVLCN